MTTYFLHDAEPEYHDTYHVKLTPADEPGNVLITAQLGLVLDQPETSVTVEVSITELKRIVAAL